MQTGCEVQATADRSTIASGSRSPKRHSQAPLSSVLHNKESSANTYTAAKFSPHTEKEEAKGSSNSLQLRVSHPEASKRTQKFVRQSISPGAHEEHSFALGSSSLFNPDCYADPDCSRASDQLYVPTDVYHPESYVKSDLSRLVSIADSVIKFSLKFEQSRLEVRLGKVTNLPKEFHKGMHCDPFVVLHLEPSREETFKSNVIKGTRDPEFRQTFQFERMSEERIKLQTLVLRIYNSALKNKAIGKICLPISEVELSGTGLRMNITSREEMEVLIISAIVEIY